MRDKHDSKKYKKNSSLHRSIQSDLPVLAPSCGTYIRMSLIPPGWGRFVRGTEPQQQQQGRGAATSARAHHGEAHRPGTGEASVLSLSRKRGQGKLAAEPQRSLTDVLPCKRRQHKHPAENKFDPFNFKTVTEACKPPADSATAGADGAAPPSASYDNSSERNVYDAVRHSISRYMNVEMFENTLDLDTVLSRVPYQYMLETLFGGDEQLPDDVPIVTRVYEESFMRECVGRDELSCVNGRTCECMFIDANFPFVATEFLLPGESSSKEQPQMCVLCSRKMTQQLFHDMLYCGVSFRAVIQRFGNICNQPGEYARECMLICPPSANVHCMPLPIVAHQRNRYSVNLCNGVKFLKQHRVYFEHYHPSSAPATADPPRPPHFR